VVMAETDHGTRRGHPGLMSNVSIRGSRPPLREQEMSDNVGAWACSFFAARFARQDFRSGRPMPNNPPRHGRRAACPARASPSQKLVQIHASFCSLND